MKKISTKIIIFGFAVLLTACNDYLNVDPNQRAELRTPADVSKLLVSAYSTASEAPMMELASDNVGDNSRAVAGDAMYSLNGKLNEAFFYWGKIDDEAQDSPANYWNGSYRAVAAANVAIDYIEHNVSDPEKYKAQLGEALVCRAYAHFMLTLFFCKPYDPSNPTANQSNLGVPYPLAPETVVFQEYPRETLAKTYELIEADLMRGLPLIADGTYTVPKYHFNKKAANAFATRFFLFKGDWDKVIQYATASLGENPVSLLRDWNGTSGYLTLALEELAPKYDNAQENANIMLMQKLSWYGGFSLYYRYLLTKQIKNVIYGSGSGTFNVVGSAYCPVSLFVSRQGSVDDTAIPKIENWTSGGYWYVMQPLFTAEEILLNRAEAYAMKSDFAAARNDLNIYYSKRILNYSATAHNITQLKVNDFALRLQDNLTPIGYDFTSDEMKNMVKVIVDTRRKEFIHEGNRWYDIRRFRIPVTHTSYDKSRTETLTSDDPRRVYEIPQSAISFGVQPNGVRN